MTRLQKMLGQIKTVEELARLIKVSPTHILMRIGVSKDNEHIISCKCENCANCTWNGVTGCTVSDFDEIIAYLNAEIPEPDAQCKTNCSTEIIALRENSRKALLTFLKKKFLSNADAEDTGLIISHHISLLETIGLFQHDELRNEILEYLEKLA
jgi:hypothetical protein